MFFSAQSGGKGEGKIERGEERRGGGGGKRGKRRTSRRNIGTSTEQIPEDLDILPVYAINDTDARRRKGKRRKRRKRSV